jgi:hypothetical protein
MANGMYLLLFYNNAGSSFGQRDPYWLAAGVEHKTAGILWSQPEIVLYDRYQHTAEAGGYPDFIQSKTDGEIYITETQKSITRIHKIEQRILKALWQQHNVSGVVANPAVTFGSAMSGAKADNGDNVHEIDGDGRVNDGAGVGAGTGTGAGTITAPRFESIGNWTHAGQGFTIDFVLNSGAAGALDGAASVGQSILDGRNGARSFSDGFH